ncbi:response regulator transcription factor [Hymenobacter sublimis]|uniref:Response regulator transcription factor n=1 Tax=Hymenobacter sublimis TaxID=2933777 RepID=A0ABY4JC58_9BACT|nr:response regulator transcription factor [Hymenobacter sublimis]UPL50190.1 response regulator transcription factor [Hymenobacter sublimis]
MPTILLVEDELSLAFIVQDNLESRGFRVVHAADGQVGLALFRQEQPDLVVADVMMPRLDGFALAEQLRREHATVPIIFLTARGQTADVVRGFELGGSDYVRKPFSIDELVVRIQARLKPSDQPANSPVVVRLGQYEFDYPHQRLHRLGHTQQLTHREAQVLHHLYALRNQVLERRTVLQALWGDDTFFNGRSLDVYITRLRRYLMADEQVQIVNIRGIGYKLML